MCGVESLGISLDSLGLYSVVLTQLSVSVCLSLCWGAVASFKAAKASAKWEDDENWSKETDYF